MPTTDASSPSITTMNFNPLAAHASFVVMMRSSGVLASRFDGKVSLCFLQYTGLLSAVPTSNKSCNVGFDSQFASAHARTLAASLQDVLRNVHIAHLRQRQHLEYREQFVHGVTKSQSIDKRAVSPRRIIFI